MSDKIKVRVTVPEAMTGIASRFLESIAFPTPRPDGGFSPPIPISVERGSDPLGDYVVESLKIRPLGIDTHGSPRATVVEVVALPIRKAGDGKIEYDVFVCPECKTEHSRGPLDPLSRVYRCLKCGYSGPKVEAEKKKETPPIPTEVRTELDDDVEIYGNAFALFSRGEWRRLDPTKVKLDLREKETARREGDDASRRKCLHCGGSGKERFEDLGSTTPRYEPCPCCSGTGEIPPPEGPQR